MNGHQWYDLTGVGGTITRVVWEKPLQKHALKYETGCSYLPKGQFFYFFFFFFCQQTQNFQQQEWISSAIWKKNNKQRENISKPNKTVQIIYEVKVWPLIS